MPAAEVTWRPSDLRDGDGALLGQLLLGFLAGVRVGQVRVEVLVEHLRCLFVEVAPLAPVKM